MTKWMKLVFVPVAVLAISVFASSTAQAQANISAGYQFAHVSESGFSANYPAGWYVDASSVVAPMFAVVGQVGGIYKSENSVTAHSYDFLGGVRVLAPATPMVTPFVQALVGGVNAGISGDTANAFSIQAGGGVDIKAIPAVGLRVGVDYRRNFFSDANGGADNVVAVMVGVVFGVK